MLNFLGGHTIKPIIKKISSLFAAAVIATTTMGIGVDAYHLYGEDESAKSTSYGTLKCELSCNQEIGYPTGYREFDVRSSVTITAPKLWFEVEVIPYPSGGDVIDEYSSWGYNTKAHGGYIESHHWSNPQQKVTAYGCSEVRNSSNTYSRATYTSLVNM